MKRLFCLLLACAMLTGIVCLLPVSAEDDERRIETDKDEYLVGEPIMVSAWGVVATDSVNLYPESYTPGKDPVIYYAHFEGRGTDTVIPMGVPVDVKTFPGTNKGHAQADPYMDIPAGTYKIVIRGAGGASVLEKKIVVKDVPGTVRRMDTDKDEYLVGETIMVTCYGVVDTDSFNIYPAAFTPGKDPTLYYAHLEGRDSDTTIPMGVPVDIKTFPGTNKGHAQADPFMDLPAGDYKLVIRGAAGVVVWEKAIKIKNEVEIERKINIGLNEYVEGQNIWLKVTANPETDIVAVYPKSYTPGHDASIYYAYFEGNPNVDPALCIQSGERYKITTWPGNNQGNPQADPYMNFPVGSYKVVIRDQTGTVVKTKSFKVIEDPDKPKVDVTLSIDKTEYVEGEPIMVTANGDVNEYSLAFYPSSYRPGKEASVYWAYFEGRSDDTEHCIPVNTATELRTWPGTNAGNPQADPYMSIPMGDYKIVMRNRAGDVVAQCDFKVVQNQAFDRKLTTDKTEYVEGEPIMVTACGWAEQDWIAIYPASYVPGKNPAIYWARFEGNANTENNIPMNKAIDVIDLPGDNDTHAEAKPYADLPAGSYKIVLLTTGNVVLEQVDIVIHRAPETNEPEDPVTEPSTEPVTDPVTEPATEPATEPVTAPSTEPETAAPATQSADTAADVTAPATDPATEPDTAGDKGGCRSMMGTTAILCLMIPAAVLFRRKKEND